MWAVTVEGTRIATSHAGPSAPPEAPVRPITRTSWLAGLLGRPDHVGGVPARGDGDQGVARTSQRRDLAREHALDAEVVGDGGEERAYRS